MTADLAGVAAEHRAARAAVRRAEAARDDAIRAAVAAGERRTDVAAAAGLTVARIGQICNSGFHVEHPP